MNDTSNVIAVTVDIRKVRVIKGKGEVTINIKDIPDAMWDEIVALGLEAMVNGGMTKITAANHPDEKVRQSEAMLIAKARTEEMIRKDEAGNYAGKIKLRGQKSSKLSGAVKTEAMRLARALVKDWIKENGGKVSSYEASEITAYARQVLDANPDLIETAKANLEAAQGKGNKVAALGLVVAEDKKAKPKAKKDKAPVDVLSAAQAGKVQKRAKPQATAH